MHVYTPDLTLIGTAQTPHIPARPAAVFLCAKWRRSGHADRDLTPPHSGAAAASGAPDAVPAWIRAVQDDPDTDMSTVLLQHDAYEGADGAQAPRSERTLKPASLQPPAPASQRHLSAHPGLRSGAELQGDNPAGPHSTQQLGRSPGNTQGNTQTVTVGGTSDICAAQSGLSAPTLRAVTGEARTSAPRRCQRLLIADPHRRAYIECFSYQSAAQIGFHKLSYLTCCNFQLICRDVYGRQIRWR